MQQETFCSDKELVALYFERTERAITETQRKYDRLCKYISRTILPDEQDVEECVSDTYIAAWNTIPPQKPNSLKLFLAKIVRRISINRMEYNHAQKRDSSMTISFDEVDQECASLCADGYFCVDNMDITETINEFLAKLSIEKRNVLVLRYWLGAPIADISEKTGMNQNTVKTTLRREQEKLKAFLLERGVYYE